MKVSRFLTLLFALVILAGCRADDDVTCVTFVQYNVGVFNKYDESSIEAVACALKEMKADIVSLNEVDSCAKRTGGVDQITELVKSMGGWNKSYASAMPFNGGAYGVGIVSDPKFPIVRTDKIALPKGNGYEPRTVAVVEYEDFVFASTHLDLVEDAQLRQVEVIDHYIDSVYAESTKPIFLAGDFNCVPSSAVVTALMKNWIQLTGVSHTFPSDVPDRCIDYIFMRPQGKNVRVVNTLTQTALNTVDLSTASDHLPVLLTVVIDEGISSVE